VACARIGGCVHASLRDRSPYGTGYSAPLNNCARHMLSEQGTTSSQNNPATATPAPVGGSERLVLKSILEPALVQAICARDRPQKLTVHSSRVVRR
jgi:hypothetical protein